MVGSKAYVVGDILCEIICLFYSSALGGLEPNNPCINALNTRGQQTTLIVSHNYNWQNVYVCVSIYLYISMYVCMYVRNSNSLTTLAVVKR